MSKPKWHKLRSKRSGSKKKTEVSGEVQLQFSLVDSANATATPEEIYKKFRTVIAAEEEDDIQSLSRTSTTSSLTRQEDEDEAGADLDEDEEDDEDATETDTPVKAGTGDQIAQKKQKKKRLARLRRKSIAVRAYEFTGKDSDLSGILFMEISRITDLPPERNGRLLPYNQPHRKLTDNHSDQNWLRYGPIRGYFAGEESVADKMHSTQPESGI